MPVHNLYFFSLTAHPPVSAKVRKCDMPAVPIADASTCQLPNPTRNQRHKGSSSHLLSGRLIDATQIRLSQIVSSLSVALDITQGNPQGHCMRTGLIGMRLAEELHLSKDDCSALFYALLLKDLGCSSNAARIAHLFGADDHRVKRSLRMTDYTKMRLEPLYSNGIAR